MIRGGGVSGSKGRFLKLKAAASPAKVLPLPVGAVMVKSFWDKGALLTVLHTIL